MGAAEPWNLAVALLAAGAVVVLAALATRATRRGPIPLALLFLLIGVLAGSEGVGGVYFDDHVLAYRIGTIALVLILFDGGISTRFDRVRAHLRPAIVLATFGVFFTAVILGGVGRLLGLSWTEALLFAAVVSSTDAAAVFSVLRGSGLNLQQRVSATIEMESGLNDPMAVILTVAMAELALTGSLSFASLAWQVPVQLAIGTAVGLGVGIGCRHALLRLPPAAAGLLPVVTAASAAISYGAATIGWGSGFLAVYVCGLVLGNRPLPDRNGLRRVHDFLAWSSQVALFLTLGLLVFPSQLLDVAPVALALTAVLVFAARPIAVALCLVPFRYPRREIAYVGWVGLRGAVPIVLATYPMLIGVPEADRLFNIVFFVVVVNIALQASTVRLATRLVGLEQPAPPPPEASLEITSMANLDARVACYHVDPRAAVAGASLAEIPFPDDAAVMMVVRGTHLLPARGNLRFEPGDHAYVFCRPEDEAAIGLWFGQRIDD
ncbi:MAG: potassium/proton antiporter [Deltaproteobacteria bacterium]|nr:potassium/proton antiporter [Kofleriaceae bacterium]